MLKTINAKINNWKAFKSNLRESRPKTTSVIDWIETLIGALIVALILRQFIVQSSLVFSGSMIPTLKSATQTSFADRLIVNKLVYHLINQSVEILCYLIHHIMMQTIC